MRDKNQVFCGKDFLAVIHDDGTVSIRERWGKSGAVRLEGADSADLEDELRSISEDYKGKTLFGEIDKILGEYMPLWGEGE